MNCYYSNLIEGHDTHPRDINRALGEARFSPDPRKRQLQHEAVAHIIVQQMIDADEDPQVPVTSVEYIKWLHREFCSRLPEEMLWIKNQDTGEMVHVAPGELRRGSVAVGRHIPPSAEALPEFLDRFGVAYDPGRMSRVREMASVGPAHHRFLWIHPFYDGNGRVARLMSYAALRRAGVGNPIWSVARGLARNVDEYRAKLTDADEPRRGDLDGRGNLSERSLVAFSCFFLRASLDQVRFMSSLLEPARLLDRIEVYVGEQIRAGRLHVASLPLLREALHTGELARSRPPNLTGYGERAARDAVARLVAGGWLTSASSRAPLHLTFPMDAVERCFPGLYVGRPHSEAPQQQRKLQHRQSAP